MMRFYALKERNPAVQEFVNTNRHRNIFQTFDLFEVYKESRNHYPFCFALEKNDGLFAAVIFGVTTKYFAWPVSNLTARAIITGGPLLENDDRDTLDLLLKALRREIGGRNIIIQFRNLWNWGELKNVFEDNGFAYKAHLDILIKLGMNKELIEQINKNKRRNVTKTLNKGTQVIQINNAEEFRCSVNLIKKTYKRIFLPLPDETLFYEAFRQLSEKGFLKVFVAKTGTRIIGTRLELIFDGTIYDWYAGSDPEFNNLYPNDLLVFQILDWGNQSFSQFDFGGAGKPNVPYGVRDYKLNFGGELVENGRFELVTRNFLFRLMSLAYFLNRKIKSWFNHHTP
jgi:lipid II:glycine glycyltransferase (peptidoglycan interpeptide bridge formation enzyme)